MYNVIGLESVDYLNKSGKRVQGVKVHTQYRSEKCDGVCVESFYVNIDNWSNDVKLGSNVEPLYNKYGKVQSLQLY